MPEEVELLPRCNFCDAEHEEHECLSDDLEKRQENHGMEADLRFIVNAKTNAEGDTQS